MMRQHLYDQYKDGSYSFKPGHKAWGVNIPSYAFDMWMPLIGLRPIAVYTCLRQLAKKETGKTQGMSIHKLAKVMRMGDSALKEDIDFLARLKFIKIEAGNTDKRNAYEVFDIPIRIPAEVFDDPDLIPREHRPLYKWLVERVTLNENSIIDPSNKFASANDSVPSALPDLIPAETSTWTPEQQTNGREDKKSAEQSSTQDMSQNPTVQKLLIRFNKPQLTKSMKKALENYPCVVVEGIPKHTQHDIMWYMDNEPGFKDFIDDTLSAFINIRYKTIERYISFLCGFDMPTAKIKHWFAWKAVHATLCATETP